MTQIFTKVILCLNHVCVGPRLQSPVLVCFDDYKTYIVICTNHVCCFSVFQGSNISGVFFPKGRLFWLKSVQSGFKIQDFEDHI